MLSSHYTRIPPFTKKKFGRITTLTATRRSFPSQYRFCHGPFPSFTPAFSQPISAIKSHWQSESCISRSRPFGWPSLLRVRSYATSYSRFNWRLRANSRVQKGKEREDNAETPKPPHRKRLQDVEPDHDGPFYQSYQDYKTRSVHLVNVCLSQIHSNIGSYILFVLKRRKKQLR